MNARQRGLIKIAAAFVGFYVLATIWHGLFGGPPRSKRWAGLPILFVALAWVGLLEAVLGASFMTVSSAWKELAGWLQWGLAVVLFFAFFGLWMIFAFISSP